MKRRCLVGWLLICTAAGRSSLSAGAARATGQRSARRAALGGADLHLQHADRAEGSAHTRLSRGHAGAWSWRAKFSQRTASRCRKSLRACSPSSRDSAPRKTDRAGRPAQLRRNRSSKRSSCRPAAIALATGDRRDAHVPDARASEEHAASRRRNAARRATPARHDDQRLFQHRLRCAAASRTRPRSCSTGCGSTSRSISRIS